MAHGGNDENATRTIYVKDNQNRAADGEFPVGTLIVKETEDGSGNTIEVTAMVKRGNNFNPDNNDWEWFMLIPDGNIAEDNDMVMRGATLMDGMCGACHAQVENKDYVFSKLLIKAGVNFARLTKGQGKSGSNIRRIIQN